MSVSSSPPKKMSVSSPTPPKNSSVGDIWYNTKKQFFYYKCDQHRWVATDYEDHVIDIIIDEDPTDAYERAMSVL